MNQVRRKQEGGGGEGELQVKAVQSKHQEVHSIHKYS